MFSDPGKSGMDEEWASSKRFLKAKRKGNAAHDLYVITAGATATRMLSLMS